MNRNTDHENESGGGAGTWVRCPGCAQVVIGARFERLLRVCPSCGHHDRLAARERIAQLLDPGSVELMEGPAAVEDPLEFTDTMAYTERLAAAREATGLDAAVLGATGRIEGAPVVVIVMDFEFMGGSLGVAVGERICHAARVAATRREPFVMVVASGGARMQEGTLALMQMAKTAEAVSMLDDEGVLTVSLITDPTYGGVAASFASLADVLIAEPGARMGFAGPRVIAQTIGTELPDGFQTAEFLLEHGLVDMIAPRASLRSVLGDLLGTADPSAGLRPVPTTRPEVVYEDVETLRGREPWQVVRAARDTARPTTLDYLGAICDSFRELRGDRMSGDCSAIVGGIGRIEGTPCVVIGHQKGHDAYELAAHNFGMPVPSGYRKAVRLMALAAKCGHPVVTLIDTPGAYPGTDAEANGQAVAIAESLRAMLRLPVPVISVVIGEGGSGGALALGVADRVLAMTNSIYSVISPEGCAAILWRDPGRAPRAAKELKLRSDEQFDTGVVDRVIAEPEGGSQSAPAVSAERVRAAILESIAELRGLAPDNLVAARRSRYRRYGSLLAGFGSPEPGTVAASTAELAGR